MPPERSEAADPDLLDQLVVEYLAALRAGARPDIADYTRRYPAHATEIHEVLSAAALMEEMKAGRGDRTPLEPRLAEPGLPKATRIAGLRIVRELGRGGMGIVYEAEEEALQRRVAVKLLSLRPGEGDDGYRRFEREARAAARLHHTNIVPVFGFGQHQGLFYYVMQLIDGPSLLQVLQEIARRQRQSSQAPPGRGQAGGKQARPPGSHGGADAVASWDEEPAPPLTPTQEISAVISWTWLRIVRETDRWEEAEATEPAHDTPTIVRVMDHPTVYFREVARIGVQAAAALAHAHQHGILHRDIKPANLMLDQEGTVWVTDFGLAKMIDEEGLTRTGEIAGTLRYMAPEQFHGVADARSDIYSLGITLFELLARRPAFVDTDPGRLIQRITDGRAEPLRALVPALPKDLERIVAKAIDPDPAARYATVSALGEDLQRFLDGLTVHARPVSIVEHAWRWARRHPALALSGTLSAGLLLCLLAMVGWNARSMHAAFERLSNEQRRTLSEYQRAEANRAAAVSAQTRAEAEFARAEATLGQLQAEQAATVTQKRRAEENLRLTLAAFDQLSEELASRGSVDDGSYTALGLAGDSASHAPLSPADAALLSQLMEFYAQLARQNGDTAELTAQSAKAYHRMGLIQQRLGDPAAARENLGLALSRWVSLRDQKDEAVAYLLPMCATLNTLGLVEAAVGDRTRATIRLQQAATLLRSLDHLAEGTADERRERQFALATTYSHLALVPLQLSGFFGGERPSLPLAQADLGRSPAASAANSPSRPASDAPVGTKPGDAGHGGTTPPESADETARKLEEWLEELLGDGARRDGGRGGPRPSHPPPPGMGGPGGPGRRPPPPPRRPMADRPSASATTKQRTPRPTSAPAGSDPAPAAASPGAAASSATVVGRPGDASRLFAIDPESRQAALAALEQADTILRVLHAEVPAHGPSRWLHARVLRTWAGLVEPEQSWPMLERSLALLRELLASEPNNRQIGFALADSLLAVPIERPAALSAEAWAESFAEAERLVAQLAAANDQLPACARLQARLQAREALRHAQAGQWQAAVQAAEAAAAIHGRLAEQYPLVLSHQLFHVRALIDLSLYHRLQGTVAAAPACLAQAEAVLNSLARAAGPQPAFAALQAEIDSQRGPAAEPGNATP